MLDINFIRENTDKVKKGVKAKGDDAKIIDKVLELDKKRRELLQKVETLRAERNQVSKEKNIEKGKKIKAELQKKEPELETIEKELQKLMFEIPNVPLADVPVGKYESKNKTVRKWGEPPKFDFKVRDYQELGEELDLVDTETAAKISGARFGFIKGDLVILEFALLQLALNFLTNEKELKKIAGNYSSKPFVPVIPPVIIKPEVLDQMARLEPAEERYHIEKDDLYLIGSAEHTLGPLHINQTLGEKDFPVRYVGFSSAFRREAGSYGKDTRGIFRVHQFNKMEIESFTLSENSVKEQDFIVAIQEHLMQLLELPYQVVAICTGDMGGPDARQIDIEAWFPAQGRYRETHTADLMTDYQARRLNTKVRRKSSQIEFVHMNDATVFAQRTLLAILENYQQKNGSVLVPKVLQKYTGFSKIFPGKV